MSINGIESLIYGVDALDEAARFYDDFGLDAENRTEGRVHYRLPDGSSVILMQADDPRLPAPFAQGSGVREVIWGVDSTATLESLKADLAGDREVFEDPDGTLHTRDDQGIAIGFRVFERKAITQENVPTNGISDIQRWDKNRRWYHRAKPKLMHHVVFGIPDVDTGVNFYTQRLKFKITDVSRGLGVFMHCDGRHDHHNLFLMRGKEVQFQHVSFGVNDIDELMTGSNHMQRQGWSTNVGIGRHRISSTLFYYLLNPAGGMTEYSADTDYLTEDWKPRLWDPMYGNWNWLGVVTDAFQNEPKRLLAEIPEPMPSFSELSQLELTEQRE